MPREDESRGSTEEVSGRALGAGHPEARLSPSATASSCSPTQRKAPERLAEPRRVRPRQQRRDFFLAGLATTSCQSLTSRRSQRARAGLVAGRYPCLYVRVSHTGAAGEGEYVIDKRPDSACMTCAKTVANVEPRADSRPADPSGRLCLECVGRGWWPSRLVHACRVTAAIVSGVVVPALLVRSARSQSRTGSPATAAADCGPASEDGSW